MGQLVLVILAVVVLIGIGVILKRLGLLGPGGGMGSDARRADGAELCRLRPELMSPAERSFFFVLRTVASDRYGVLAKVRVGDILQVPGQGSLNTTARNKIQQKHADFVLCDPTSTRPLLVIELDDSSHERAARRERDGFVDRAYGAAGLPVLHVPAARAYSPAELDRAIREKIEGVGVGRA